MKKALDTVPERSKAGHIPGQKADDCLMSGFYDHSRILSYNLVPAIYYISSVNPGSDRDLYLSE
jgi:hypothetical protein